MHRFRILYSIISIGIALALSGCAVKTVEGFDKKPLAEPTYTATYFADHATDYIYKAHISVYGNDFGGIFIAKRIDDVSHRVAFTTEFGNKLFDFTITDTDFTVNYILEELDRKIILNTLKKDFMLLLKKKHDVTGVYENSGYTVYTSKSGRRDNYLFTDKNSGQLKQIVNATKSKEKVIITFEPKSNTLADKIIINHKNIKLNIDLTYINK
jgi:hypothetical protein